LNGLYESARREHWTPPTLCSTLPRWGGGVGERHISRYQCKIKIGVKKLIKERRIIYILEQILALFKEQ